MALTQEQIGEIRTSYRQAKDLKEQVTILSQLYDVPKAEIEQAVAGVVPLTDTLPAAQPPKKRRVRSYDQAVRDDVVKAVLLEGLTQAQAAERYGVPKGNVHAWIKAARERQAEFGVEPPARCGRAPAKAEPPAPAGIDFGMRVLKEINAGIDGLHRFIDNFADVDILSDDEREILDRILSTASGFAEGLESGLRLAKEGERV